MARRKGNSRRRGDVKLGERVATARGDKGWTQEELAKRIGRSGGYVGQIEAALNYPGIATLRALAAVLGERVDYLTDGSVEVPGPVEQKVIRLTRILGLELVDFLLEAGPEGAKALVTRAELNRYRAQKRRKKAPKRR